MPKNLRFVKGVVENDNLLPINVNIETLKKSKIIKFIYKKLVRKTIYMQRKLAGKEKPKKEKYDEIDYDIKVVDINENGEVEEKDNEELVVDTVQGAPPLQDTMTTTTVAVDEEGGGRRRHGLR